MVGLSVAMKVDQKDKMWVDLRAALRVFSLEGKMVYLKVVRSVEYSVEQKVVN